MNDREKKESNPKEASEDAEIGTFTCFLSWTVPVSTTEILGQHSSCFQVICPLKIFRSLQTRWSMVSMPHLKSSLLMKTEGGITHHTFQSSMGSYSKESTQKISVYSVSLFTAPLFPLTKLDIMLLFSGKLFWLFFSLIIFHDVL